VGHGPTPSKAAIKGHPVHPILIPFPIAFGSAVVFTDLAYWLTDNRTWALASAWLLWTTLATGILAAATGAIDYYGLEEVREHSEATQHGAGNAIALLLVLVNALLRSFGAEAHVVPRGLVISVGTAAVLAFTGYLGGELSYKHMIGVNPEQSEPESPILGSHRQ
jgi:uncharacterized membrane protein